MALKYVDMEIAPNAVLVSTVTAGIGQTSGCARIAVNLGITQKNAHHWNDNDAKTMSETKPQPKFVAVGTVVFRGSYLICRACSHTMARRIANALNVYKPNEKGY